MQFYSVQAKETIEVPDEQVERTTMANGRPAARATITRDGKTLKLFKWFRWVLLMCLKAIRFERSAPSILCPFQDQGYQQGYQIDRNRQERRVSPDGLSALTCHVSRPQRNRDGAGVAQAGERRGRPEL